MVASRLIILSCVILAACHCSTSAHAAQDFQKNNPDIAKFEFTRSYISALDYINQIKLRWQTSSPKKVYAGDDVKVMRGYVAFLIKDDADLRIAKNYVVKYLDSSNFLMIKAVKTFIGYCEMGVLINDKEKEIWDQWYAVKSTNLATPANEQAFIKAQKELSLKRKENGKDLIEASVLVAKVLRSARNADDKGHLLAITAKEREKLLKRLDDFGRDTLDWGLKPGLDHVQASIAVIREVLEDSVFIPANE